MTKYRCTRCDVYDPCFYDSGKTNTEPIKCPLVEGNKPHWEPIRNEDYGKPPIPDWVKVGEWIWSNEDQRYLKVLQTTDKVLLSTMSGFTYYEDFIDIKRHYKEAHIRPYNAEEMKALVGKVIDRDGDRGLVLFYEDHTNKVYIMGAWFTADIVMKRYTINGLPCGVLEHLNEEGKWVE